MIPVGGQQNCYARRSMRAGLAKEEYATTWQEENEGKPQAKRVPQPQDQRGAEDEAHGTFACRCLTKDERAQDRDPSEASRQATGDASRQASCEASREAKHRQPQAVNGRAAANTGANRTERADLRWRHGWPRSG